MWKSLAAAALRSTSPSRRCYRSQVYGDGFLQTRQDAVDPCSSEVQCHCCRDTNMKPIDIPEDKWLLTSPNKPGLCKGEIKLDKQGASTGTSFTIEHRP